MKTKVINCGNYSCVHQSKSCGTCLMNTIAIDKEGKCILFTEHSYKRTPLPPNEMDEHTNMC